MEKQETQVIKYDVNKEKLRNGEVNKVVDEIYSKIESLKIPDFF